MHLKTSTVIVSLYYFFSLVATQPIANGPTSAMNTASDPESDLLPKRQDANGGFTHIGSDVSDLGDDADFQDFLSDYLNGGNDR